MNSLRAARGLLAGIAFAAAIASICFTIPSAAHAQATVSTGSIQGAVLDPKGATIPGAKVTVTSKATGQKLTPLVTDAGEYNAAALVPGEYIVRVEAPGFKTAEKIIVVQVGLVSPGTISLEIGESTTVVTVESSTVSVNTEQAIVSGVLTTQQIEQLPINGRNFLDLAQLEPGVQIQDGSNFDPTKTGFSSISFGGRFGRTARIAVDGVDISDETVGTTTSNIPESALQEFQLSQSSLDLSNDLTSSGAVNITTRSGTNQYHGQAFGLFRDSSEGALLPHPAGIEAPYQRSQFGGNFGGPIVKDKLFFFMDAERTKQELFAPVVLPDPFTFLGSGYATPYRETDLVGKIDYTVRQNLKLFYRFDYFENAAISASSLSPFKNKDYTRNHVFGADYNMGSWTHSFRFEYLKFQNQIVDGTQGLSAPGEGLGVEFLFPNAGLLIGPNFLAPQTTPQSDHQYKYDASKVLGKHILRFGGNFNHLQGGGFAKFFALAPRITNTQDARSVAFAHNGPFPSLDPSHPMNHETNPLNYPVELTFLGNGLGFGTEKPSFGFPAGGLGPDNRVGLYIGDSWKIKSNLTLSAGLRYDRDTGRTDSDVATIDAINAAYPGLGNRVRQPNLNFAPQAGVAWDPFKSGKTVIRAGVGMFYENVIWNNVLFDRPFRLPKGAFAFTPNACLGIDQPVAVPFADGTNHTPPVGACGDGAGGPVAIGNAAPLLVKFQQQFQAAAAAAPPISTNSIFLPTLIASGSSIAPPSGFFAPNYQTPRSVQMNIGVQRQVWKGGVVSADFLRNVGTHQSLAVDVNHVGDSRFFNLAAAQAAIARTLNACGAGLTLDQAIAACPGLHPAMNGNPVGGVTMGDFAQRGLGVPGDAGAGACIPAAFAPGTTPFQCAFGGSNPNVPGFFVQEPIGRSTYDALQVKLVQNIANPVSGIRNLNFQVSYSLSRFDNTGGFNGSAPFPSAPAANDLDFVSGSLDSRNPFRYFGPSTLDRTHQLSFGGVADFPFGLRAGVVAHFYSALPDTLFSQNSGNPGEIFRSDFTGDGTVADPLPNTRVGAFGRDVGLHGLTNLIQNFNQNFAGQATPAGQVLVQNGLFTLAQLQAIGGVIGAIPLPPADQVPLYGLRAFDLKLSWVHKFRERLTIEPGVSAYNLFNFANFDLPTATGGLLSGTLSGTQGSLNGTNYVAQSGVRVGSGSGVFGLGAPRVIEWNLKITF
jgi:Carboxypeptidase regulatory-like domain/TonB dependent receptor